MNGKRESTGDFQWRLRLKFVKPFLISFVATVVFLAVILISAGRLDYWPAWAYAAISTIMNILMRLILNKNPDLEKERSKPGSGAETWDKKLLGIGLLLTVATLVIAGLDAGRYHWSPHVSLIWPVSGIFLNIIGLGVFLMAMKENRFFSAVVRIQNDRGHAVCNSGPYKIVRHPGNAGMIIGSVGLPFLFMSVWSAIPAFLSVVLLIARTQLEDSFLKKELEGYGEYQRITVFRLIPGIW